ncbi:MAG: GGDEF domain-containing protein [Gemmatimonadales bacterium]
MRMLRVLEHLNRPLLVALGFGMITGFALVDYFTGTGLSFSVFYLVPIAGLAWYAGRRTGLVAAGFGALAWLLTAELPRAAGSPVVPFWNSSTRLVVFVVVVILLTSLKSALRRETTLARTDYLTGAANARAFYEAAESELERMRRYRHPFTVAYMDIDDFKSVNDRLGHSVGNDLLRAVVETIADNLRTTDMVARLGGDEFAILFPETGHAAAHEAVQKIQARLLAEMQRAEWPVSFSIGVLTCLDPPRSVNSLVKYADDLMYSVKGSGKNAIRHEALVARLSTEPVIQPIPTDQLRDQIS